MSDFKTYEYIWLDGYQPEANMRSKVKATDEDTPTVKILLEHVIWIFFYLVGPAKY